VREDGRRDEMSKAIIGQTGGIMYSVFSADFAPDPAATKALGGMSLQYMLDNNVSRYVQADTLEELAEKLGMPADALVKTIDDFNSYTDGETVDPLGRVAFSGIKIETAPFYAYPRSPAVHHTMGGVLIDAKTRALNLSGEVIDGLYCAGEITGVLHGANRVGGNAIVDFVVFGRIAGEQAAKGE
ncbi:MAG: FAD-binding protein, partial [Eubacteriales bacterium]|nr:FAD-binding protein [Eubacteriales bacterium]